MGTSVASSPTWSRQVREAWTTAGLGWSRFESLLLHNLSPVTPHLICALRPRRGDRVLDVGCGLGEPALSIAPFVGSRGEVVGVDVSRPMITTARRRAKAARAANVRFLLSGVERLPDREGRFDAVTARYGIMFPEDPEAALRFIHSRMNPGGRIALAVWGPLPRNPYFRIMVEVSRPLLSGPPPDTENSPHAMRFARSGRLAGMLRSAGFREVAQEGIETPFVFASADQYAELLCHTSGTLSTLLPKLPAARRRRVVKDLVRAVSPYADRSSGVVRLPGHSWIVSGRR